MSRHLLLLTLIVCSAHAASDRITRAVDPTRTVALAHHARPRVNPEADRGPADPDMPIEWATLLFKPAPDLEAFLAAQQLPGSPDYHRWLTPEQFGERFGLSPNDLTKVTRWLESNGLHIDRVARGRHWITFTGAASRVARAFHTQFRRYEIDGAVHFANTSDPEIPEALAGVVGGFLGLDDLPRFQPAARPVPLANTTGGSGHAISPDDFATIYNVSPLHSSGINGTGQRIAVVGQSALDLTDIRLFRKTFNLPASDPERIVVGRDPGINSYAFEAIADIQMAGGIARNAQIVYVYSASVFTAIAYAADTNVAPVISVSFAGCEAETDLSFRVVAQQANAQGITILAGSGDWGAATCDQYSPTPQASKGVSVAIPASFPEVTAVGGTQFNDAGGRYWTTTQTLTLGSAISYIPETVWNDIGLANSVMISTGGGPSGAFPKPYWQSAPGVPDDHVRDLPDVSLGASAFHYGYLVVYQGTLAIFGGTSASAPAFAGVVALLNQALTARGALTKPGLGNLNPALYRLARTAPAVFHDITAGNNNVPCAQGSPACVEGLIGFSAGPGYDLATGLGSVDVQRLIASWDTGGASTTRLSADPAKAGLGDKVTLTATVSGSGAAPTGTVTFLVINGIAGMIGTADLVPSGDGASASLSVDASAVIGGDGVVTAFYSGNGDYGASSGVTTVGVNAPASGSMVVPFVTPAPSVLVPGQHFWPISIVLSERAGVATTLTSFTFNGGATSLALFSSTSIPANGSVTAVLAATAINPPADIVLHFAGRDASGATWSRDVTQRFVGPPTPLQAPGITLVSSPASVALNPQADAACQWSYQLVLRETGGFLTQITSLRQGATDLTASLQQLFGTTRLAPYGSLTANMCAAGSAGTGSRTFSVTGSTEVSATVTASTTVSYANAAASPATLAVTPAAVTLSGPDATATLSVKSAAPWTVSVLPAKPDWLTLSSTSDAVSIAASAAGLSRGAWTVTLVIQSPTALPQTVNVPLTLVVGASADISIGGVAHGASFTTSFAPGMVLSVFGSQLAPTIRVASDLPLPLTLAGVSATVNGVSAPLYFVSPSQLNVQVPYETTLGPAVLAVNNNGQVAVFPFTVSVAAPGIFAAGDGGVAPNPSGARGQTLLAFITGDGDQTPTLATGATPPASTAVSRLPKPRLPVSLKVGGVDAPIVFVGVPYGLSGVTQINFVVPDGAPFGDQPVVVTVGGIAGKPAKLTVQ